MGIVREVELGFVESRVPAGTHSCQIYTSEEERRDSLLRFVRRGLLDGERCACFSDKTSEADILRFLGAEGIPQPQRVTPALTCSPVAEIYFQDGVFDPDHMLQLLTDFDTDAIAAGFPASRVIGEMSPDIHRVTGGSRLLEYEARVSLLLRTHPLTAVCQYGARSFDGATIMDVLKVHPMMIVRGAVVKNPFWIPPEEFLG